MISRKFVAAIVVGTSTLLATGGSAAPSGSYLAARVAMADADFRAAARFLDQALVEDRDNLALLENATLAYLALGDIEKAAAMASRLEALGQDSQYAELAVVAQLAAADDFDALLARTERNSQVLGPLTAGLVRGWAQLGKGDMTKAIAAFDEIAKEPGLRGFANYHKALALGHVGDFEGAVALFDQAAAQGRATRRGVVSRIEAMSQLGKGQEALQLLDETFGRDLDLGLSDLRAKLEGGEKLPFTHIRSARDGLAEVFFSIAGALRNEADDDYTLIYARIAEYLRPDHVEATLMAAGLLADLGRSDMAIEAYERIPRDSFAFPVAELGRADALFASGREDAAIEVLKGLAKTHGEMASVHAALGDAFRRLKRYEEAVAPYDRAIAINEANDRPSWFVYYTRGIVHERLGHWDRAEADFRRALELNPDQPQVLNYLGYSLVEQRRNLDEALEMIRTAVEKRPDSGYIVDSLGWVLYRLGRYDEAVGHMERAVELEAVDPIVNDHLGDVYWAVGRYMEARFQWRRALSFITDDTDLEEVKPDRIRRKLEVGLDKVLEEEGAPPLKVAGDQR